MAELQGLVTALSGLVGYARENASTLSTQTKARFMQLLSSILPSLSQQEQPPEINTPIPDAARLLWVASGSQPSVFANYVRQYPDPSLDALRNNPNMLLYVMDRLDQEIPKQQRESSEGIQESWVPSSNIWGFRYDPSTKSLFVKFNGEDTRDSGPVYRYYGVPAEIFEMFRRGSIPAKTNGSNQWGRWWKGKVPSIAASHWELIRKGAYPYTRVS